jgi:ornithine cyclodeaminase
MFIVPEAVCPQLVSMEDAFEAVEAGLRRHGARRRLQLPVVREAIGHADALYGFKAVRPRGRRLGLKAGGYWPHNLERGDGLINHQSTVFLFDPTRGAPSRWWGATT